MELFRRLVGVQDTIYGRAGKDGRSREDDRRAVLPKGCLFCLLVCFCFCYTEDWERELSRDYGLYSFFCLFADYGTGYTGGMGNGLIYVSCFFFASLFFSSFILDVLVGFVTCLFLLELRVAYVRL
ncbi:hypothetical protein J3E68DRAFT_349170 [Trichoderma sp. SZMC 28012]